MYAEDAATKTAALRGFQKHVMHLVKRQQASTVMFQAAVALLTRRDSTAVVASKSAALLHIPQAAFAEVLRLIVSRDGLPGGCLGRRTRAPLPQLCRLLSAPPAERGLRCAAKALHMMAYHRWLMRLPQHLQLRLIAQARVHSFSEGGMLFAQVCDMSLSLTLSRKSKLSRL